MQTNIVFFGNTRHSAIVQKALFEEFGLRAVVTIPDRLVGRKQVVTPSPTKIFAKEKRIPVLEADKLTPDVITQVQSLKPDFLIVTDYGLILPKQILDLPKIAALNVHHSLLPKYRGPSPASSAILAGEKISGVTVIKMTQKVDAGEMVGQTPYTLAPEETTESLLTQLNIGGAKLIVSVIKNYENIKPQPQNEADATFTKYIEKNSGLIDFDAPPEPLILDRMIRAYYPWPSVWGKIKINNKDVRIKLLPERRIQREGGKPMSKKDFLNGYPQLKEKLEKIFETSY